MVGRKSIFYTFKNFTKLLKKKNLISIRFVTGEFEGDKKRIDFEKIKKTAEKLKKNNDIETRDKDRLNEQTINKIMEAIRIQLKLESIEDAWILVTGLLQGGGSNLKAGNAVSFSIEEKSLTSHELNKYITQQKKGITIRQFARAISDNVADIALILNLPGDLHRQMKLEYPDLSDSDAVWCSNFQTYNKRCPEHVRLWLVSNYKSRFNR
jgi:hypothetical protein